MEREGYDSSILSEDVLFCLFTELDNSRITKESIPLVIEKLLKNESMDVDEIISSFGLKALAKNM
jgi:Glu-tRNA(Gln) amidotransferase subunit E-like FAD-binding protein